MQNNLILLAIGKKGLREISPFAEDAIPIPSSISEHIISLKSRIIRINANIHILESVNIDSSIMIYYIVIFNTVLCA